MLQYGISSQQPYTVVESTCSRNVANVSGKQKNVSYYAVSSQTALFNSIHFVLACSQQFPNKSYCVLRTIVT